MFVLSAGVYLVNGERLIKGSKVLKKILDDDQKQLEALNILQCVMEQLQHPKSESLLYSAEGSANSHRTQ